ncbi:MAG: efflux RND transporter periplasmic adaptor subunit [Spirochaetales bacterium]|nr:efflux RND transporter periplasmic adaptor subunit [Spirochaetales bacterium]
MKKKRYLDLKYIIPLVLVSAGLFYWFGSTLGAEEKTGTEIKPPVVVTTPAYGSLERVFRLNGYVEAETTLTVLPRISGSLTELSVQVGEAVQKGRLLAEIDSEPYSLTLQQAEAAYLAAKSTFERLERLYESHSASKQSYDDAKAQYEAYKSQYELARLQYNYTRITSPIDGVVLARHTSAGSLVAPQVPIVTIGDLSSLVIHARVPERYFRNFYGNTEELEISGNVPAAGNTIFQGKIKTLSPYISPETKSFEVTIQLSGDTSMIRPGMFIRLTFQIDRMENIHYLPFAAITGQGDLWYVDRETETAGKIRIEPDYSNDEYFMVPEEYAGYAFIIEGQHFLREHQAVRIVSQREM